jgi:hypothetical protein
MQQTRWLSTGSIQQMLETQLSFAVTLCQTFFSNNDATSNFAWSFQGLQHTLGSQSLEVYFDRFVLQTQKIDISQEKGKINSDDHFGLFSSCRLFII